MKFPSPQTAVFLHSILETIAYGVGFRIYLNSTSTEVELNRRDFRRFWCLLGCLAGAWIGAQLLAHFDSPPGGKTIVGGLLGGWLGVELAKWRLGIKKSMGDALVVPICVGIAIGRIGCFLAGLADDTYGIQTDLPWGVDFGDGVSRHPTQIYELLYVMALAGIFSRVLPRAKLPDGFRFRLFMFLYLGFRFWIEFIKPRAPYGQLSAIQWASLFGCTYLAAYFALWYIRRPPWSRNAPKIGPEIGSKVQDEAPASMPAAASRASVSRISQPS